MIKLSEHVRHCIAELVTELVITTPRDVNGSCTCGSYINDCICDDMELTIATNKTGTQWAYQTGDNSYTGACYSLPLWAVTWVSHDSDLDDVTTDIINQLEELLNS